MYFIKNRSCHLYIIKCVSVPASVHGMTVPICLKAGGSVQLVCKVYGYPIPTVHFFKDNSSLPQDDHTHVTNSTLTITNIEPRDGGVYSCSADNGDTDYSIGHALVYCSKLNYFIPIYIENGSDLPQVSLVWT